MSFMDEQMQIESQIGFFIGILVGVLGSGVMIMFFTDWEWYFKAFAFVGQVGIVGMISLGLYNAIKTRRRYLEAKKEMESEQNIWAKKEMEKESFLEELKGGNYKNGKKK
jgi:uncharacterized membrane protein YeaQ/YmgE (transglycosylase-associated protein family)